MRRRRERHERYGTEPFIARACPHCGSAVVIARCVDCESWFAVCDCNDATVSFDGYLSASARCAECRVWERFEEPKPSQRPRRRSKGRG